MAVDPLNVSDALGLIKDYDGAINGLWNIYLAALAATLTVLTSDRWKPRPEILAVAFVVFAIGNLLALWKYFAFKDQMIDYVQSLVQASESANGTKLYNAVQTLRTFPIWGLFAYHLVIDAAVLVVIYFFSWKPHRPRSHAQPN